MATPRPKSTRATTSAGTTVALKSDDDRAKDALRTDFSCRPSEFCLLNVCCALLLCVSAADVSVVAVRCRFDVVVLAIVVVFVVLLHRFDVHARHITVTVID